MIKSGPLRGRTNAAFMLGGYVVGQGGILLAQSWLAAHGHLELVGFFGLAFTMATLAYLLVDWGGQVLLARHELAERDASSSDRLFWNLSALRFVVALLTLGGFAIAGGLTGDEFGNAYLVMAAPALLLGSLNPTGLIDGMHRSGLNGIATMLPYVFSAIGLVLVPDMEREAQGLVLGMVFTLGTTAALTLQFALLREFRGLPHFVTPSFGEIWSAARNGSHVVLTALPPQAFFRVEIGALMAVLGPEQTGLFVYARQILGAILQTSQFLRRAEFPGLVERVAQPGRLRGAFGQQRASIGVQLLGAVAFVLLGVLAVAISSKGYSSPVTVLAWAYAATLVACAIFTAALQILLAMNKAGTAAMATNAVTVGVGLLIYPSVTRFGLYGIALVDFVLNALCAILLVRLLRHERRKAAAVTA